MTRQMILGAYMVFPSMHSAGMWRHSYSENAFEDRALYERYAQAAERAKFDLILIPERVHYVDGHTKYGLLTGFQHDPTQLAAVVAGATNRIGLGVTLSASFNSPYNLARTLGSLDILSGGRAAWNIVMTAPGPANDNFPEVDRLPREELYERGDEVLEATTALWSSWDGDAVSADRDSGIYADTSKIHAADYKGKYLSVQGPLTLPQSPQGRPVFIQAGESVRGREFGGRWADLVFAIDPLEEDLRAKRKAIRGYAEEAGRDPDSVRLVAAVQPIVGETTSIAKERQEYLRSLIHPDAAIEWVSHSAGLDLSQFDPSTPIAEVLNRGSGPSRRLARLIESRNLTIAETAELFARNDLTPEIVGSPQEVADELTHLFESGAADGFILTATHFPQGARRLREFRRATSARSGRVPARIHRNDPAVPHLRHHSHFPTMNGTQPMTTSRLSSIPIRVAILASTLAVAAGCSTATPAASADSEPVSGGDLTFAINTFPPCIDKTLNGQTATAFHPLYDKLVDQNLETGEIVPWLATSWEVRNDGRRFVFALRDGVTFSNGERLDAQVVADNFESQKRLGDSGFATTAKSHLANFTGAEVLDASTVALNFSEPSAGFLQAARSDTLAIIAPESLKKTPEERCAQGVIASGPFVQKELETNAKVVLARRDGYHWGSSLNKNKGEAYLDSITFLVVPESSVRIGGLTSGQLDAAIDIPSTDVDRAEGAGLTVIPSLAAGINDSLLLNPTFAPVLADLNVRRALVKGIDTQQIIDTTYTPSDEKARSILSVKAPGYTDLSSEYTYDPSGAKSLLDASGWTVGGDGFRTKDGEKLTVELAYRNHLPQSQFELIQSQLRDIGVAVNLQPRSTAEDNAARTDGTWESIYFQSLRADGDVLLVFSPTLGSTKGIASTPELNALLVKQSQTVDVDARNGVLKEIQELIADQALAIPLHASSLIYATTSAVHDLRIQADLYSVDFVDAWKS